ncbi:MAG: hypothetical protein D6798_11740 [Deltaproteobacteria bacterium]|nr:MAG: hypothetical protein D6798_11740 [Deltaproteobacteria bacterium]
MTRPLNVMVTGADSPVGERLIRDLLDDSRVDRILAVPWRTGDHLPPDDRLTIVPVDLSSSRRVHDLLFGKARDLGIDVVAHTQLHRSAREEGPRIRRYNVDAVRALLTLSERHPTIRRIVLRSDAVVYQLQRDLPVLIGEHHPLNMSGAAPQWVTDRVEADVTACTRMGMTDLEIVVLRTAEILAPGCGSQLYDYLESTVCLRPAGYDPMINVLTILDCSAAMQKAIHHHSQGVFNIPGADTLPLTAAIRKWGRVGIPMIGALLSPAYRLRSLVTGHDFRYGMNRRRFLYSGVLDGTRAREVLGYVPCHPVEWPAG